MCKYSTYVAMVLSCDHNENFGSGSHYYEFIRKNELTVSTMCSTQGYTVTNRTNNRRVSLVYYCSYAYRPLAPMCRL